MRWSLSITDKRVELHVCLKKLQREAYRVPWRHNDFRRPTLFRADVPHF